MKATQKAQNIFSVSTLYIVPVYVCICIYITTSLLTLNFVFICLNKLGEHNAPAHNAISSVVIACPWSESCSEALIRSMYIVGVPYMIVHLLA